MPTVKLADSHSNIHTIHLPSVFTAKILKGHFLTFSLFVTKCSLFKTIGFQHIGSQSVSVYRDHLSGCTKGERIVCLRRTRCEGVYVLVLHFSPPENGREGAAVARTHKFSPSPPSQIRIVNERGMFGNKRVERHQREMVPRFFFFFSRLGRRAF